MPRPHRVSREASPCHPSSPGALSEEDEPFCAIVGNGSVYACELAVVGTVLPEPLDAKDFASELECSGSLLRSRRLISQRPLRLVAGGTLPKAFVHVRLPFRHDPANPSELPPPLPGFETVISLAEDVFGRFGPGDRGEINVGLVPMGSQAGLAAIRRHCASSAAAGDGGASRARVRLSCRVLGRWNLVEMVTPSTFSGGNSPRGSSAVGTETLTSPLGPRISPCLAMAMEGEIHGTEKFATSATGTSPAVEPLARALPGSEPERLEVGGLGPWPPSARSGGPPQQQGEALSGGGEPMPPAAADSSMEYASTMDEGEPEFLSAVVSHAPPGMVAERERSGAEAEYGADATAAPTPPTAAADPAAAASVAKPREDQAPLNHVPDLQAIETAAEAEARTRRIASLEAALEQARRARLRHEELCREAAAAAQATLAACGHGEGAGEEAHDGETERGSARGAVAPSILLGTSSALAGLTVKELASCSKGASEDALTLKYPKLDTHTQVSVLLSWDRGAATAAASLVSPTAGSTATAVATLVGAATGAPLSAPVSEGTGTPA